MKKLLLFLIGVTSLWSEWINRPVVNIYIRPEVDSELETQAIYGTPVIVLEDSKEGFSLIQTPDRAEGWVESSALILSDSYFQNELLRPVKNLFAHIYRVPDTSPNPPLMTLPYGTLIQLENVDDISERWLRMELIDGQKAWVQRGDLDFSPRTKTLEEMIAFSRKFLGLPYTWGGTSSYGFDCSGFIQMLFKEMGIFLPRNAREQVNSDLLIPVSRENIQPGDLLFFGETRIIHVGLYLGNGEFIHSNTKDGIPAITINHLDRTHYVFNTARRIK